MFYAFVKLLLTPLCGLLYGFRSDGREAVPATGAVIVACNHRSLIDPVFAAIATPGRRLHFMAKAELFRNPLTGCLARALKAFPVERGKADRHSVHVAEHLLAEGHILGIFPEGTRHRAPGFGRIKTGAFTIARQTGVAVVPLCLSGNLGLALGPLPVFRRVTARFGPALSPERIADMDKEAFAEWLAGEWERLAV